jgi:AcrR family transcriptional regulator
VSRRRETTLASPGAHIPIGARRRPTQDRARATVAAITEAASRLLVERGYDRVSTNLIARRAGVSVGSLYQYFTGKEAIYAAIIDAHIAEMRDLGERALTTMADPRADFATSLRRVLEAMVSVHTRDDDLMRAIERELMQVFPHWHGTRENDEDLVAALAPILARRPDCRPAEPLVAARLVTTVCHGVVKWLLHGARPGTDPEPYLAQTVAVCCQAAGARCKEIGGADPATMVGKDVTGGYDPTAAGCP